ncbi:hypothetical protein ACRALDRAFT_208956 [Sodiomyces alcalophilus JCM 7366]|uniref:uncharacterized protein n=1 Tax=Sodiomyces alcalophilus JCM 7366 TaxID=591952 RepID=UPI0039B3F1DC
MTCQVSCKRHTTRTLTPRYSQLTRAIFGLEQAAEWIQPQTPGREDTTTSLTYIIHLTVLMERHEYGTNEASACPEAELPNRVFRAVQLHGCGSLPTETNMTELYRLQPVLSVCLAQTNPRGEMQCHEGNTLYIHHQAYVVLSPTRPHTWGKTPSDAFLYLYFQWRLEYTVLHSSHLQSHLVMHQQHSLTHGTHRAVWDVLTRLATLPKHTYLQSWTGPVVLTISPNQSPPHFPRELGWSTNHRQPMARTPVALPEIGIKPRKRNVWLILGDLFRIGIIDMIGHDRCDGAKRTHLITMALKAAAKDQGLGIYRIHSVYTCLMPGVVFRRVSGTMSYIIPTFAKLRTTLWVRRPRHHALHLCTEYVCTCSALRADQSIAMAQIDLWLTPLLSFHWPGKELNDLPYRMRMYGAENEGG